MNPGRHGPSDPIVALARRVAAAPAESLALAIEHALREAHRAGAAEVAARLSGPERDLVADLSSAAAEGEVALVQPLGPCPGLPWQMEVGGEAVLDGGFAASFPDAAVRGLVDREILSPGEGARMVPGPRFGELVRVAPRGP